jgi:integrase
LIGTQKIHRSRKPQDYLLTDNLPTGAGGDFDNRYSQRGVQWAVKQVAKAAGIIKEVHTHTLRHSYATHLLEDGMDIMTLKDLWDIKMLRLQWNTCILPN